MLCNSEAFILEGELSLVQVATHTSDKWDTGTQGTGKVSQGWVMFNFISLLR